MGGGRRAAGGLSSLGKPSLLPLLPSSAKSHRERKRERGEMPFGGEEGGAPNDVAERRREKNGAREGEVFLGTRGEKKKGGGRKEEKARAESGEGE